MKQRNKFFSMYCQQASLGFKICKLLPLPLSRLLVSTAIVSALLTPYLSQATVYTVTNNFDDNSSGSLRYLISNASSGDTISFAPGVTSPINLTSGEIALNKNLTIVGPGARFMTISSSSHRIFNNRSTARLGALTLKGQSGSDGGAINNAGTLNLYNIAVKNSSAYNGGAISNTGTLNLFGSTLSGNSASNAGGAIHNDAASTLNINNSTISGNSAVNNGSALINFGSASLNNTTVTGNSSNPTAAVDSSAGTALHLKNSIIADNGSNNLSGTMDTNLSNIINTPSLLGTLTDNGGQTDTHLPQTASAAINAGDQNSCTYTDQRGISRQRQGGCDIGAVEVDSPLLLSSGASISIYAGQTNTANSTDGTLTNARFFQPAGLSTDGTSLFIADTGNYKVRKINLSDEMVTTLAGNGSYGSADGTGGAGGTTTFSSPTGIVAQGGFLYLSDSGSNKIRRIDTVSGDTITISGSGSPGADNGPCGSATFNNPVGISFSQGSLLIADNGNNLIRKIAVSPTCTVSTLAGGGSGDGFGITAGFNSPKGLASDGTNLYVADTGNSSIRKIDLLSGQVTTLITGVSPVDLVLDNKQLYFTETLTTMKRLDLDTLQLTTVASSFSSPVGISHDGKSLFVADSANYTIHKLADTTPPADSTSFTATSTSSAQIDLSWSAATDNAGVTGYRLVFDTSNSLTAGCGNGTTIYNGTALTYPHTGLTNGTTYYYRLCATDAAGNWSSGAQASTISGLNSCTWLSPVSGNWSDTAKWSCSHVPGAADNVIIDPAGTYTVTVDVSATVNSLAVGNVSGVQTVSIPSGRTLTLNSTSVFTGGGVLNLESGGALTGNGALTLNTAPVIKSGGKLNLPGATSLNIAGQSYTVINSLGSPGDSTSTTLQGIKNALSGNYVLGSDIDAAATSGWNSGAGFLPLGNATTKFTGKFDGLGHTISNLTINRPGSNEVGLFGYTDPASAILHVGLVNAAVTGYDQVGALVGYANGPVSDSYATAAVSGRYWVGGLLGASNTNITNSYSTGTVSGQSSIGGLVGSSGFFAVSNSYSSANVTATNVAQKVGGFVGDATWSTISNSYSTGSVSGSDRVGGFSGSIDGGGTGSAIANCYSTGTVTGTINTGGFNGYNGGPRTIDNSYWNTTTSGWGTSAGGTGLTTAQMQTASSFTGFIFTTTPGATGNNWVIVNGDGSLNSAVGGGTYPLLAAEYSTSVKNSHQLQLMQMAPNASYTLATDIDATKTATGTDVWSSSGFVPVGYSAARFRGSFDGLGHTIANLYINRPTLTDVGLFGLANLTGCFIQNVGLLNANITGGTGRTGALAGYAFGIESISNSYSTGTVTGAGQVGGLIGYNYAGLVKDSYSTANVTGTNAVSGEIGGLVGNNSDGGTLINVHATGTVSGGAYSAGGLAGQNTSNTYGALSSIINAYSTGNVTSTGTWVGGLAGGSGAYANIVNSYATGAVNGTSGNQYVGGLVGQLNGGRLDSVYATGNVSNTASGTGTGRIGGLVGSIYSAGSVNNAFSTGSVSGTTNLTTQVGGLLGTNSGRISNSYSTGLVTGGSHSGGFVGNGNGGTYLNDFWDTVTSGKTNADNYSSVTGVTGLATVPMKTQASYPQAAGQWDFTNTWNITEGVSYPTLRPIILNIWTGSSNSLWGTDGNWSLGHAPLTNESVFIPTFGSAIDISTATANARFILARTPVTLNDSSGSLTVSGLATYLKGLSLTSGTLALIDNTYFTDFTMSGGALVGTGALTIGNSYSKTGGAVGSSFTGLAIVQMSGNIAPGAWTVNGPVSVSALAGDLTLDGSIASSGALYLKASGNVAINQNLTAGGSGLNSLFDHGTSGSVSLAAGMTVDLQNGILDVKKAGATSAGTLNLAGTLANTTLKAATLASSTGSLSNVTIGSNMTQSGPLTITNNLTLGNAINFDTGGSTLSFDAAAAHIKLASGATAATLTKANGTLLANNTNNSGVVTIASGVTLQGYGQIFSFYSGGSWVNNGIIDGNGNGQTLTIGSAALSTFTNNGVLNASAGTVTVAPVTFTNTGTVNVASGVTLNRTAGFINNGTLSGSGTVTVGTGAAKLADQGTTNPGGSGTTGTLTLSGDLQLNAASNLNIDIGGTTAGQFDQVAVTGAATLTGTLNVNLINSYVPNIGDSFTIMTCDTSCTGAFGSLNLPPAGPGKKWNLSFNPTNFVLSFMAGVVVTPATITDPTLNTAYDQTLIATAGTGPYSWTVSAGALPTGVTLDSANSKLTGTPTASGPFNFTIRATDTQGNYGEQSYTIFVSTTCITAPNGLVGWWKGETNTSNVALDQTDTNNGTFMYGATVAPRGTTNAFSFDGIDDSVQVASPLNIPVGNSARTISAWVNSAGSLDNGKTQVIAGFGTSTYNNAFFLERSPESLGGELQIVMWGNDILSGVRLDFNKWYHVAVTHDGTTTKLFVNGNPVSSSTLATNTLLTGEGLLLGMAPANDGLHEHFNGLIDEVQLYNTALDPADILAVYQAGLNSTCAAPKVGVSPANYAFGTVTVGGNASWPVTIANTGTADLSLPSAPTLAGNADFSLNLGDGTGGTCGSTYPKALTPRTSCTGIVKLAPTAVGARTPDGLVTVTSNDPLTPSTTATFTGTGTLAQCRWKTAANGNWNVAGNWDCNHVPDSATDDAIIDIAGGPYTITLNTTQTVNSLNVSNGHTLNHSSGTLTVNSSSSFATGTTYNLSGGTLSGSGTLTLAGSTHTWSGGTFMGNLAVAGGATLAINGAGAKTWGSGILTNDGTINWSAGNINQDLGWGSLTNNGQFNITAGLTLGDLTSSLWYVAVNFINNGTLTVAPGAGNTVTLGGYTGGSPHGMKRVSLTNSGTVDVQSGALSIEPVNSSASMTGTPSTTTSTGIFNISSGATLSYGGSVSGGTHTLVTGAGKLTGTGTLNVSNGSVTLDGNGTTPGTIALNGGTLSMGAGATVGAANLTFAGGTMNGSGLLTLNSSGTWSGGTFMGKLAVANGATLAINGGQKTWGSGILINDGTINWSAGNIDLNLGSGSLTNNGQFNITGGLTLGDVTNSLWYCGLTFNNNGTLTVAPGAGNTATLGGFAAGAAHGMKVMALTNSGTVDVQSGTLAIEPVDTSATMTGTPSTTTSTGIFNINTGATLRYGGSFGGGTHTLTSASSITGTGTIYKQGGSLTVGGAIIPATNSTAGGLTFTGPLTETATTVTKIDIGGTTAGTNYDQITVSGAATISGSLNVNLINSFVPAVGDNFTIMTYGSHTGTFSTPTPFSPGPGKKWSLVYNATNVVLSVVAGVAVTPPTLPDPLISTLYDQPLTATGGAGPYSWTVSAGTLPSGLSLDPSTGAISGTPGTLGSASFTIRATDTQGYIGEQRYDLFVSTPCATTPSGLVGWWKGSGDGIDQLGKNNVTTSTITYSQRNDTQSFSLNGTSSYLEKTGPTSDLNLGSQSWSVSSWVKTSSQSASMMTVVSRFEYGWANSSNPGALYELNLWSGGPGFRVRESLAGSSIQTVAYSTDIRDGKWHLITGILDRTDATLKLYVDGQLKATQPVAGLGAVNDAGSPLEIGREFIQGWGSPSYYFDGQIDEVQIYNRALDATEILNIYNTGSNSVCTTPAAALTPASHDFGNVAVGSSASTLFTIANSGTAPLGVTGITASEPDYSIDTANGATCASITPTIPAGTSCSVNVTLAPTSLASKNATMSVASNAPDMTATLTGSSSQYNLAVTKTGSGAGTVTADSGVINCGATCAGGYNPSDVVTLTAASNPGSTFVGWSGDCSGNSLTCQVTIDAVKSVSALFNLSTSKSGIISSNTTWTRNGGPYLFTSTVTVNAGVTLTIEAGTIVKFANGAGLTINGNLNAPGTAADKIYFTSIDNDTVGGDTNNNGAPVYPLDPRNWNGIYIGNNGTATLNFNNISDGGWQGGAQTGLLHKTGAGSISVTNSDIRNYDYNGIYLDAVTSPITLTGNTITGGGFYGTNGIRLNNAGSVVSISGNSILNNSNNGIYAANSSPTITLGNVITGGAQYGIYATGTSVPVLDGSNTLTGNAIGGMAFDAMASGIAHNYDALVTGPVYVTGGSFTSGTTTWSSTRIYVVRGSLTINAGATLSITAGRIIKFYNSGGAGTGTGLTVNGTLDANGSAGNVIYFTSIDNDTVGGDTNGNGAPTYPLDPRIWNGIYIGTGGTANLNYCNISDGGWQGGAQTGLLHKIGAGTVSVMNSAFTNYMYNGIYLDSVTSPITLSGNTMTGGGFYGRQGMRLNSAGSVVTISGNSILNSSYYGIQATNSSPAINGNTISGSTYYGIYATGTSVPVLDGTNTLAGNTLGGMAFDAAASGIAHNYDIYLTEPVNIDASPIASGSITWSSTRTYHIRGIITVSSGATLNIAAGLIIKFASGAGLSISGDLQGAGASGNPIYFTSIDNDSIGGDTNNNGAPTYPLDPRNWNGIYIYSGGTATLNYCNISDGGWNNGQLHKTGAGNVTVTNSIFSNYYYDGIYLNSTTGTNTISGNEFLGGGSYSNYGIYLNNAGTPLINNNSIHNNNNYGIYLTGATTTPDIFRNSIHTNPVGIYATTSANPVIGGSYGNGNYLYNNATWSVQNTGSPTINATYNYWGSSAGPYHATTNTVGNTTSKVTDFVDYASYSQPPAGSIAINGGALATNTSSVDLTLSCTETTGCSEMELSNDSFTTSSILPYATSSNGWPIPAGEGTKTVSVKYRYGSGTWSGAYSASIIVDTTPPVVSIGSPSVATTTSGPVSYTVSYTDSNFNTATLATGNITLNSTGTATGAVAVSGTGATRTVTVSSITGYGSLGISLAANTASDLAGNQVPAAGPSATFTVTADQSISFGAPPALTYGGSAGTVSATATSGLPVTFSSLTTGICTISGTAVTPVATGTCTIAADQGGDGNYNAAVQATQNITVDPAAQSPLFVTGLPTSATFAQAGIVAAASGGSSSGAVTFDHGTSSACTVNVSTGAVTVTSGSGTCDITATKAADTNYTAITSAPASITSIIQAAQTTLIVTGVPTSASFGQGFTAIATGGSSSGAVAFAAAGACTVNSSTGAGSITSGTGTCDITATKAGDANYTAISGTASIITITPAAQTTLIVTGVPTSASFGQGFTAVATGGSSSGAVAFAAAGVCTVDPVTGVGSVTSGSGTCYITATKAADANYTAISGTASIITITPATQTTLTVTGLPSSASFGQAGIVAAASGGSSSGAVTFSAGASTACSVNASTGAVTITSGSGSCDITATRAGDANYIAITSAAASITTITPATQTALIVTGLPTSASFGQAGIVAAASGGSSSGAVTFSAGASTACSVNVSTGAVTITSGSGSCDITATRAGDANYIAITSAAASITTITPAPQTTLTVTGLPTSAIFGQAGIVAAASGGSSSGAVTFSAGASTACSVNVSTGAVTITSGSGSCDITATRAGDANYIAITSAAASITTITPATQTTLTVTGLPTSASFGQAGIVAAASGGSSSGAVTFSAGASTACSVNASTGAVTITSGTGTCSISATKAADSNYIAISSAPVSITVATANQTISFGAPPSLTYGGATGTVSASATSALLVTYSSLTSAVCTITGATVSPLAAGTCTIAADQAGNANFSAATQVTQSFAVTQANQVVLTVNGLPASATFGQAGIVAAATGGSSSGAVTFSAGASTACSVNASTGAVTITSGTGTCLISATKAADSNYTAVSSAPATITIAAATQTISFGAAPLLTYGGSTANVSASASSALPVTFSSLTTGVCTIAGATVAPLTAGTCTIAADQAGNANFSAATQVTQSFAVAQASQGTLTVTGLPSSAAFGQTGITAAISGGSGTGAVTLSAGASTACSINPSTGAVSITSGTGTCSITASKATDTNYTAITSAPIAITIYTATQSISFGAPPSLTYGGATGAVSASATSLLAVSYSSLTSAVCTTAGAIVTPVAAGTCTIAADQAGNGNFSAAAQVTQSFAVAQAAQWSLTVTGLPASAAFGQAGIVAAATGGSSSGTVTFSAGASTACSVNASTGAVTITSGTGTCLISATKAADSNYTAVSSAPATITVAAATQTISFGAAPLLTYGGTTGTVTASATSLLPVTFTSLTNGVCTVAGVTVTPIAAGTCTIAADQVGDGNFLAAQVTQSFTVAQASQGVLTVTGLPASAAFGQTGITAAASGGAGTGTVTYSSGASTACSVNSTTGAVAITSGTGICLITATKTADSNYTAVNSAAASITITQAAQATVTVNAPANAVYGQTGLFAAAVGGSGTGVYSFDATGSTACTVHPASGAIIITNGTGTCMLTATKAADSNFMASAVSAPATVLVNLTIAATATTGGTISPAGVTTLGSGAGQAYTISTSIGYHITDVKVDGVSQGAIASYTFSNVTSNHTIDALIAVDTFTITTSTNTGGSISPAGATTLNIGATQSYIISPDPGFVLIDVKVDQISMGKVPGYTINNLASNHTIEVIFGADGIVDTANKTGEPQLGDALITLTAALGDTTLTPDQVKKVDTAPMINGVPQPDGKIDLLDVLIMLRRNVGLEKW